MPGNERFVFVNYSKVLFTLFMLPQKPICTSKSWSSVNRTSDPVTKSTEYFEL